MCTYRGRYMYVWIVIFIDSIYLKLIEGIHKMLCVQTCMPFEYYLSLWLLYYGEILSIDLCLSLILLSHRRWLFEYFTNVSWWLWYYLSYPVI